MLRIIADIIKAKGCASKYEFMMEAYKYVLVFSLKCIQDVLLCIVVFSMECI